MRTYNTPTWVRAFTTGQEPFSPPEAWSPEGWDEKALALPRQTHSANVLWMRQPGRPADTDAVITDVVGLPLVIKTADCIPVLLYDRRQRRIAAVHAGWRGTVQGISQTTIRMMQSEGRDLSAIIGPGISQPSFEVGEEVYEAFLQAGFPMQRIARRETKWHLDLFQANAWLLEEMGVTDIHIDGTCTFLSPDLYSARRDTIHTGRNLNGIVLL